MSAKLVVTNKKALRDKYGPMGFAKVRAALRRLVLADHRRGITTVVVGLDKAADMAVYSAPPVTSAMDQCQVKDAIDAVCGTSPDYLLILGAPDIVPHQHLDNPVPGDGDPNVPSDLPYACTHPYSRDVSDFLAPSRVTGRLPDVMGGRDADYLVARIDAAVNWTSFSAADYADGFVLGAASWKHSTLTSARKIFTAPRPYESPPTVSPLGAGLVSKRAHFINCHGATADPHFYGEGHGSFPVSMSAADLHGNLPSGSVASVECCYGAELYNPSLAVGIGLCQTYLEEGAYGFFGSTNIAYGPAIGNGASDLIAQFFLRASITGSSLGGAELDARRSFVSAHGIMSPIDLKTLAQFLLLGDPSIRPVAASSESVRDAMRTESREFPTATAFATKPMGEPSRRVAEKLSEIATEAGMESYELTTHEVHPRGDLPESRSEEIASSRSHLLVEVLDRAHPGFRRNRVIVALEVEGEILAHREYFSKGTWRGRVVRKRIAQGSKSDRQGVVMICDDDREYVLRRLGGNPFRDEELEGLVGHRLVVEGDQSGQTLILRGYRTIEE